MLYRDTPKKPPTRLLHAPGISTRGDAEKRPQSIGDHQASDGVQRADLFTVALLGIARCGKTRSAGPLLRDDAAGQQQQRDDEQGAAHAGTFAVTSISGRPFGCGHTGSVTRCHAMSGRSTSQVSPPSVALSIAGHASAATAPRARQLLTTD